MVCTMRGALTLAVALALLGCDSGPAGGAADTGAAGAADSASDGATAGGGADSARGTDGGPGDTSAPPDAAPDAGSPSDAGADTATRTADGGPSDTAEVDVPSADAAVPTDAGPADTGPDGTDADASPPCEDACPADGATACAGEGLHVCAADPGTGCLAWGPITPCAEDATCEDGACVPVCEDECAAAGTTCSADDAAIVECGDLDGDPCLDATTTPCPAGSACAGGVCAPTCTDECAAGQQECATAWTIRTCGQSDGDPCLEWGAATPCPMAAACTADACEAPCTDECMTASPECQDGGVAECGQHDADACLEWSAPVPCQPGDACDGGECLPAPPPAAVLINEALVDAPGADGAAGTTVFVELWGPPGQALDGYALVGVNGASGDDYKAIPLDGHAMGPDGLLVVAHPDGAPAVVAVADLLDDRVDYQNGPDSLQVRWYATTVDALGYGAFGPGDVFAGEGSPAAAAPAGQSLSRDPAHTDTDDNAADFAAGEPSPGLAEPPCADACPAEGATLCADSAVQTCGDHDADPCLEWGAPVACAPGLACSGDACGFPWLPNYLWNVHAGGSSNDWAMAVATDATGAIYAGGIFQGPFTLGGTPLEYGNTDVFLTRMSPAGDVVWARDIGGGAVDYLQDVVVDPQGDVVFTGWFGGSTNIGGTALSGTGWEAYVAKYTAAGDPIWARSYPGSGNNEGVALAAAPTGDLYLAGAFQQTWSLAGASLAAVGDDGFLAKLDPDGTPVWALKLGGPSGDRARGVAVDPDGNVAVAGTVGSLVDFDPGPGTAQGGPGLYVAKYTADGQYLWHWVANGQAQALAADPAGPFYVAGTITGSANLGGGTHAFAGGSTDGVLVKLSANGAYMWSAHLGSAGADAIRDVALDPLGGIVVTGDYGGATTWRGAPLAFAGKDGFANQEDAFVSRLSPTGQLAWVSRFGGPGQEWGHGVASSPSGRIAWAGHFGATVVINDDTLESQGAGDLAILGFAGTADGLPGCYGDATCAPGGVCQDIPGEPACACLPGYAGPDCGACAPGYGPDGAGGCESLCVTAALTCPARSHCEPLTGVAQCVCDAGWTGADCDACAAGYTDPKKCAPTPCACVPDCGATAPAGACDTCEGAPALWPGEGTLTGFLVGDKGNTAGGCGGSGPDHALRFALTEPTRVELSLVTSNPVLYLRATCDDPMTQLACSASKSGLAKVVEVLPPGEYTLWIDSQDGNASSYTLEYSFRTDPCVGVSCDGDLVCTTADWLATTCACPKGTAPQPGEPTACDPILPPLKLAVDVDVSNTCDLSVDPLSLTVPKDRVATITYTNLSADYHVDVDSEPGVDTFALPQGESWTDPKPWCADGISGYADITATEGCSATHRLFITCQK